MAVEMTGSYEGELTCKAVHGPSGSTLATTAPTDNGGAGTLFSPTDLLATSIATCMLTILGQWAIPRGLTVDGATFKVVKHMVADPVRRIGRLELSFRIPGVPEDKRESMQRAMLRCPAKASLHPDVVCDITYEHV